MSTQPIARLAPVFTVAALLAASQAVLAEDDVRPPGVEEQLPGAAPDAEQQGNGRASADVRTLSRKAAKADTPEKRAAVMEELYQHLAAAPDADSARPIALIIEQMWRTAGGPTAEVLIERAATATAANASDVAMRLLDTVVELNPAFAEGWNRRAYGFYMQKDYTRALGDLRRVLALDPRHFKALEGVAMILRQLGEKKAALAAYRKLVEVYPEAEGAKQVIEDLTREVDGQGI